MKILRTEFRNIKLYDKDLIIDFIATDKIVNKQEVIKESNTISRQKVISIAGINATGKTLTLRLIKFVFKLLEDNTVLKSEKVDYSLFKEDSRIIVDFILNEVIYRLECIIGIKDNKSDLFTTAKSFYFKNEFIYKKDITSVKTKIDVFNWNAKHLILERNTLKADEKSMLTRNHSMIIKITNNSDFRFISFIDNTNINALSEGMNYNTTFTNLFDDSLAKIEYKNNENIKIKFKNNETNFEVSDINEQFRFLSSGTIKGATILTLISALFHAGGGYLIIDEIEAHLNKTLVEFLMELFMDDNINKNGSVLIFTTHYLEILDSINRKDAIYVTTKEENYNLNIEKFSSVVNRNDVKKSEVLLSNYFGNTAPSYELMQKVKKVLCENVN